jgi:hypothetical protein
MFPCVLFPSDIKFPQKTGELSIIHCISSQNICACMCMHVCVHMCVRARVCIVHMQAFSAGNLIQSLVHG